MRIVTVIVIVHVLLVLVDSGTMGSETRFTYILGNDTNIHLDIKPKCGCALL